MKRVISLVLTLCIIATIFCGCGQAKDESSESDTTAASAPTSKKDVVTVQEVKDQIMEFVKGQGVSREDVITNEKTNKESENITSYGFNYISKNTSATIKVDDNGVKEIIVVTAPSEFSVVENPAAMAGAVAIVPLSACHKSKNIDTFCDLILGVPPKETENTVTYNYTDGQWKYSLTVSMILVTATAKRLEKQETTTTVTQEDDQSEAYTEDEADDDEIAITTQKNSTVTKTVTSANKGTTNTTRAVNKGTTTATKAATPTTAGDSDPCAYGHNWEEITQTVSHDEVGHYEEVVTGYNTITKYKCAVCYAQYDSLNSYYTHFEGHLTSSGSSVAFFRDRYTTSQERQPIYGNQWVVDQKAYTEERVVGYRCRRCGKTK